MATYSVDAIGVVSLAKVLGVVGLLWGVIVALTWLVFGGPIGGRPGLIELVVAVGGGALYGVLIGLLTALVYNAAAGIAGGLELDLSEGPPAETGSGPS
jgi:hypothetical protein